MWNRRTSFCCCSCGLSFRDVTELMQHFTSMMFHISRSPGSSKPGFAFGLVPTIKGIVEVF